MDVWFRFVVVISSDSHRACYVNGIAISVPRLRGILFLGKSKTAMETGLIQSKQTTSLLLTGQVSILCTARMSVLNSQYDVIECLCNCHCDLFIYLGRAYSHPVDPTHPRSLSQVKNLVSQSPRAVVSLVGLAAVHALYRRSHLGFLSD